ncbi:MAG: hypothetical protein PF439_10715, partial [Helicobacteraceae bacterium]|nr:hypothetical protein [Helicobacteraceae bacterium]
VRQITRGPDTLFSHVADAAQVSYPLNLKLPLLLNFAKAYFEQLIPVLITNRNFRLLKLIYFKVKKIIITVTRMGNEL